uniref:Thioredoxin reductase 1, cytoplasmic n=1 Tax=Lygus hesperus TaxID=30085 RepID=A0A0A9X1G3_LYGHE
MEFSQRKLSELGSRKSPPPKDLPTEPSQEATQEVAMQPSGKAESPKTLEKTDSATKTSSGDQKNDQSKKEGDKLVSGSTESPKKDIEVKSDGKERVDKEASKTQNVGDTGDYMEDFQVVVVAAGRRPNVADLGLQNLDIKLDRNTCKIMVNAFDQTSVENIFAVGQVSNAMNADVQAVAKKAAQLLARRMFSLSNTKMEYRKVPMLILTPVEYAYIGDSEETAKTIHGKIEVYHNVFTTPKSSLSNRFDNRSYVKLICSPRIPNVGSQVLGIHLLAPNAGEVLQGFVTAFGNSSLTKEQLDEMVGLHPTVAEVFSDLQITKASGAEIGLNVI